jgi:hypothetical protein
MKVARRRAISAGMLFLIIALIAWNSQSAHSGRPLPSGRARAAGESTGTTIGATSNSPAAEAFDRDPIIDTDADPFKVVSFLPVPPKVIVAPLPPPAPVIAAPVAPTFPYRYFGRMTDIAGRQVTYLTRDNAMISIQEGGILDNAYRIESVAERHIVITYLPLNEKFEILASSAAN